ncbi:MAG: gliding motility-associated C-terminal domain-containing protein [Saprospiraceae bacterium]|nr:gliding motility-associated C-terminal domain-containing protein [Saprospiraceae bacterium]
MIKPSNTNSIYKATIKTNLGCIYRDSLILNLRDVNQKQSTKNICKGDSLFYKSQWIKRDTIVFDTINSITNCDTIHTIALTFEKLSLDLGKDTTICVGDSLMLTIPGFANYSWTTSPDLSCTDCSMPIIKPSKNTNIYTLEVRSPLGCSYTDQFVINTSNAIKISETKMICRGDSIFWKDGWKKNTGNYIFKNTASICDTVFQLQLNWFPTLKLFNPDTIVCEGSTLQYSAQGTNSIKWISKNSISCDTCPVVNISALQNDNLILYSKDANQCDFIDSISIRVIPTQNVTSEVFLCLGEDSIQINNQWIKQDTNIVQNLKNIHQCDSIVNTTVRILSKAIYQFPDTLTLEESTQYTIIYQPTRRPNENWSWQSDLPISCSSCDQAIVTATKDGEVLLTIEDENGCTQIHRIIFKIKKQTTKIIIPNIISPNGDQLNDVLDIFSDDPNLQINFLRIFDRWGELIYEVKNQTLQNYKPWNGTFRGKNVINGVYVIHGHFVFSNGKSQEVAQDISVIR